MAIKKYINTRLSEAKERAVLSARLEAAKREAYRAEYRKQYAKQSINASIAKARNDAKVNAAKKPMSLSSMVQGTIAYNKPTARPTTRKRKTTKRRSYPKTKTVYVVAAPTQKRKTHKKKKRSSKYNAGFGFEF